MEMTIDRILQKTLITDIGKLKPDLNHYICNLPITDPFRNISGVVMVGHPLDDVTGKMDTSKRIAVVCLGVSYTIYRKKNDDDDDDVLTESKKIACQNCYEYDQKKYTLYNLIPMRFYSHDRAQNYVANNTHLIFFNNKHDVLHEFAYDASSRFPCNVCRKKPNIKCIPCGNLYSCVDCHEHSELKGHDIKTFNQAKILRTQELITLNINKQGNRSSNFIVCHTRNIDVEFVVLTPVGELPWDDTPTEIIKAGKGWTIKVY